MTTTLILSRTFTFFTNLVLLFFGLFLLSLHWLVTWSFPIFILGVSAIFFTVVPMPKFLMRKNYHAAFLILVRVAAHSAVTLVVGLLF